MRDIPTIKEPEKLRAIYKEVNGDFEGLEKQPLEFLENILLKAEYEEKFKEPVEETTINFDLKDFTKMNKRIRYCLKTGTEYTPLYHYPKDVLI